LLGLLLGCTLRDREGGQLYRTVDDVRALAKSACAGDTTAFERRTNTLAAMPVDAILPSRGRSHISSTWPTSRSSITVFAGGEHIAAT
jgi:hypothetical protein